MTPNRLLKNNFQPACGVKEPSLLHCKWFGRENRAFTGQKTAKTAHKQSKVSVSEHTYPVSIYILDFYWMGGVVLTAAVKIAQAEMFTSEGQSSLERMVAMPVIIFTFGLMVILWVAFGLGAMMARKEGER